jgi:hypothetical protein
MGDPAILAETIPHQRAKLNRPGEKFERRRKAPPRVDEADGRIIEPYYLS